MRRDEPAANKRKTNTRNAQPLLKNYPLAVKQNTLERQHSKGGEQHSLWQPLRSAQVGQAQQASRQNVIGTSAGATSEGYAYATLR